MYIREGAKEGGALIPICRYKFWLHGRSLSGFFYQTGRSSKQTALADSIDCLDALTNNKSGTRPKCENIIE